jgi:hypothetical protein
MVESKMNQRRLKLPWQPRTTLNAMMKKTGISPGDCDAVRGDGGARATGSAVKNPALPHKTLALTL